jgi:cellulose synthase/poly-beta-1,6-N-acetylglucosamine synthase-like glycosyltransferase
METFVSAILAVSASLLTIPIAILFLEVVAAITLPRRDRTPNQGDNFRGRVAVLMPAHNESSGLLPTIADIQGQLHPGDRLLVVADNCTDDTAAVATTAGDEVAERNDPANHGKGYALAFGLRHLASDPPEIVIVVDADCRLAENTIERLAMTCALTHRPTQALYLMTPPDGSRINHQVAEFAWRVKNWVRPLGLSALGLPCQLVGTGMAFPWNVIRLADLANGSLVEDLKLGLDLASRGYPPVFCPPACVTSQFASSVEGAVNQRARWEQGHITTILTSVPRLLCRAITRRNWGLLALTLDLAVPPLSLLGILVTGMLLIAVLAAFFGFSSAALVISALNGLVFLLAAYLAWLKYGLEVLPPGALLLIAPYALGKLGLYLRILFNKMDARWIRTDRTKSD